MSEPKLISPMLDNFAMGDPISDHNGVRSCPAMDDVTGKKYIVKIISSPATATQLEAMLLTGAFTSKEQALAYYEEIANGIVQEVKILSKLADLEGFMAFDNHQLVPMDDGTGYDVYLLGTYKMSLAKFFRKEPMTHLQALNLGLDLCAALETCRRSGYLYVNLKPENIYLTTDNGFRIGDLGFLKLDSLKYATLPDRYRSNYTAPEATDDFAELDPSLDVYAAGMILYQAFNGGQLPTPKEDGSFDPPDYADYEMAEIILKACDPNPENRWGDPAQMGHALVDYMQRNGAHDTPIVPPTIEAPEPVVVEEAPEEDQPDETVCSEINEDAEVPEDENAEETNAAEEVTPEDDATEVVDDTLPGMDQEDLGDAQVSEEVSEILSQADELLTAEVPEPVVVPEPIEVTLPESPAIEEVADEPAEATTETDATSNDEAETPQVPEEVAEEETPENIEAEDADETAEQPVKKKRVWLKITIALAIVLALLAGAFAFCKFYYFETIDDLICDGEGTQLNVTVKTDADDSLLYVICTDTYGNQHRSPVKNGVAAFTDLQPNSPYTIAVKIDGFHKLIGKTTSAYATPKLTTISDFEAFTGNEDGSVVLRFAIDGPEASGWNILYLNDAGEETVVECADHMATIQGLTVGQEYTFTISPADDINYDGTVEITHTVSHPVVAKDLYAGIVDNGVLPVYWFIPEGTTVESWNVHCFNENGYDKTITVTDTFAEFEDLSEGGEYTIEVTAKGMLTGQRIAVDTAATQVTDLVINAEGSTAVLSWNCDAELDDDWFVEYTIDSMAKYTITGTTDCSIELPVLIPGARYMFVVGNGKTAFIGNVLVHTANKDVTFDDFGITNEDITLTMCYAPDEEEWNIYDLQQSDITDEFKSGDNAGFAATINTSYSRTWRTITVHTVIRDNQGQIVALQENDVIWRQIWSYGEGSFELPELPDEAGDYVAYVYIDGALVGQNNFTIKN